MLSTRTRQQIRWRYQLHGHIASAWDWDSKTDKMIPAHNYVSWNIILGYIGGSIMPMFMITRLILIASSGGLNDPKEFAMFVVGMVESFIILNVNAIQHRFSSYRMAVAQLMNHILGQVDAVENMMVTRNLTWSRANKKIFRTYDILFGIISFFVTFSPTGFIIVFLGSPFEPIHVFFKDWFDVDVKLNFDHWPILLFLWGGAFNLSVVIFTALGLGLLYMIFANTYIRGLRPQAVHQSLPATKATVHRCNIETSFFGLVTDTEYIHMYRIHQLINNRLNDIYACMQVSIHHTVCLLIFVAFTYVFIAQWDMIIELGFVGGSFVFGGIFAVLAIQYVESTRVGEITENWKHLVVASKNLSSKSTMFHKFIRGCPLLTFKTAHPFFRVSKETFPEFVMQGLDFLIDMLMFTS